SALLLCLVALGMAGQSIARLISPTPIHHEEAIVIAVLGLLVNLACAWLLGGAHHHHHHHHGHEHEHSHRANENQAPGDHHPPHHHDLNLRSAYLHVLADAATSVLAILALMGGMLWGADWLDPV